MKILIFLLLLPVLCFSQTLYQGGIFAAADTIGSITVPDSIEMQFYDGPWKLLTKCVNDTSYVTVDDKVGEVTKIYYLAGESYWTYSNSFRFRIYATGVDTITSNYVFHSGDGAYTLFIKPDTVGTNTLYGKSWIEGK